MIDKRYRCTFCDKTFQRKTWYDKHKCAKRKRFDEAHNTEVLFGHRLFNHWCSRNGFTSKGKKRTVEEFCKSPFYHAFMRLVDLSQRVYLVSVFQYLDWLISQQVKEPLWVNPSTVERYRKAIRNQDDPTSHVRTTYANVKKYCADRKIPIAEFFSTITPGDALNWIMLNKLRPWVLFGYDRAVTELLRRFDDEKLHILDEYVNTAYWIDKIEVDQPARSSVESECTRLFG